MISLLIKSLGGLFGGFFFPEAMPVSKQGGPRVRVKKRRQAVCYPSLKRLKNNQYPQGASVG